jgi:predicted regulator of Ras-like GTPase activity (Roadblock/LC7/MglB family)
MTNNLPSRSCIGAIIQSTLDEEKAKIHSAALSELTAKASHIVGLLNRDDELTFLRIRSKQREIMVSDLLPYT